MCVNVDNEIQDRVLIQPVQQLPKIIAVMSGAPQQSNSTNQNDVHASLVLQPVQHTTQLITVVSDGGESSSSSLQGLTSVTMETLDNNDQSYAEQEEDDIEDTNLDSKIVLVEELLKQGDENCDENASPNTSLKRPSTNKDVGLLKSKKRYASTEMKFRSFNINWSKVSDTILDRLTRLQEYRDQNPGKSLPSTVQFPRSEMTSLTNTIVDQLRCIDIDIPAGIMESVARQVYSKYSGLQFIDDDGHVNHQSYVALKHKLINRNSYLNRFKNPDGPKVSIAEVRRDKNVKSGTLKEYWSKSSEICAKDIVSKLITDDPKMLSSEFLSVSQAYVRFRLDEEKVLRDTVAALPVLRRRQLISYHFEKATGVPMDTFEKYFFAKRAKMIDFLKTRTKNMLSEAPTDYDIINSICFVLGEKLTELIIPKELGTKASEITTECAGPVLVSVDLGNNNKVFYVFAEQAQLSEGTHEIVKALAELMAVHYIYNFMYMKGVSKVLEFIQVYFLKITPSTGTKSKATRKSKQQRLVQSVIEAISNHELNEAQAIE